MHSQIFQYKRIYMNNRSFIVFLIFNILTEYWIFNLQNLSNSVRCVVKSSVFTITLFPLWQWWLVYKQNFVSKNKTHKEICIVDMALTCLLRTIIRERVKWKSLKLFPPSLVCSQGSKTEAICPGNNWRD